MCKSYTRVEYDIFLHSMCKIRFYAPFSVCKIITHTMCKNESYTLKTVCKIKFHTYYVKKKVIADQCLNFFSPFLHPKTFCVSLRIVCSARRACRRCPIVLAGGGCVGIRFTVVCDIRGLFCRLRFKVPNRCTEIALAGALHEKTFLLSLLVYQFIVY